MSALDILSSNWPLAMAFALAVISGVIAGQILFVLSPNLAIDVLRRLDARRKPLLNMLYTLLHQSHGTIKVVAFVFVVNLLGASLFQHSVGGLLILPPFGFLFMGGLLIGLIVRKYPERFWITAIVSPFEFGAFIVAATGGVNIGLGIWRGDVASAVQEWITLFVVLVIPLQFINALLEGTLANRVPMTLRESWPESTR